MILYGIDASGSRRSACGCDLELDVPRGARAAHDAHWSGGTPSPVRRCRRSTGRQSLARRRARQPARRASTSSPRPGSRLVEARSDDAVGRLESSTNAAATSGGAPRRAESRPVLLTMEREPRTQPYGSRARAASTMRGVSVRCEAQASRRIVEAHRLPVARRRSRARARARRDRIAVGVPRSDGHGSSPVVRQGMGLTGLRQRLEQRRRSSRSRRAATTRWRAGATAPSSRGGTTTYGQCNVPALPAGSPTSRSRRAVPHGGASERRLGRRVGGQRLRPVQRAGAAGRAHLRRGRGGLTATRWRAGATAPSSRGGTTPSASATFRRFRPGSPTSRSRRATVTRWRGGATARSSRGGATTPASATCRRFRPGSPTSRSRRAVITRWRAGATAPSSPGGTTAYGQCNVPALPAGLTYVEVAAGGAHTVARRSDGSVVAWGDNDFGQCNVPALPAGLTYVEVAAGDVPHGGAAERRLGRRVGGQRLRPVQRSGASGRAHLRRGRGGRRVTRWRAGATAPSSRGGTTTSASATCRRFRPGSPTSRSRRAVAHTVARRSDGSVVAWGSNATASATCRRFRPGSPTSRSRRAATHTVARRSDGSVVAWGDNDLRPVQRSGASGRAHLRRGRGGRLPHGGAAERRLRRRLGVQRHTASATCRRFRPGSPTSRSRRATAHTVARRSDGSVVAWGDNTYGQCNVPALPAGLTYVEIAAGCSHTVARRSDGSVVAWGRQRLRPVQRAGAAAGGHLRRDRGGRDPRWRSMSRAPPPSSFCTAGTTSHGCQPSMWGNGIPSASGGAGFTIAAGPLEGGKSGIFFYGIDNTGFTPFPWGGPRAGCASRRRRNARRSQLERYPAATAMACSRSTGTPTSPRIPRRSGTRSRRASTSSPRPGSATRRARAGRCSPTLWSCPAALGACATDAGRIPIFALARGSQPWSAGPVFGRWVAFCAAIRCARARQAVCASSSGRHRAHPS